MVITSAQTVVIYPEQRVVRNNDSKSKGLAGYRIKRKYMLYTNRFRELRHVWVIHTKKYLFFLRNSKLNINKFRVEIGKINV